MTSMIGVAVVSPVLPTLQAVFELKPGMVGLVISVFTFPGIIFIPILGVLSDRYGRKPIVVPLLFLYGIAGGLSGLAPDFETLLVMRFLTGIGASSLGSLTLVLVGDFYEGRARSAAFGYRLALGQVANGVTPLLAGGLTILGWRYPFLIYLLALPVGLVALFALEEPELEKPTSLKVYLGKVFQGVSSPRVASLFTVVLTLTMVNHGINLTFLPVFMEDAFGASALVIGMVISARVAVGAVVAANMGYLSQRFGEELLLKLSLILLALSLIWMPFTTSVWMLLGPAVLAGITVGTGFPAFQSLVVREAPQGILAGVMAANSVVGRTGQTLGPILAGLLIGFGGSTALFMGGAIFVACMLAILLFGLRRRPGA